MRRFNRAYTQRIGVLDDSYLGTGRALGPSRVLFEITESGSPLLGLRRQLDLDSGYLSRLLRQLEGDGLVTVANDPDDGRQRVVHLTADGRRERARLDNRAGQAAAQLLTPLAPRQRSELANALATAERLLRAATVGFEIVDPVSPPATAALDRYFAELDERFTTGFDPGDGGADEDAEALRPPDGAFVLISETRASAGSDPESTVGCGGLQRIDDDTAEVKRMWIHPDWRGLGMGKRLLAHLEEVAAQQGRSTVILDTNEVLIEAVSMYRRAGYHPTERYSENPYAHHWFIKHLA